MEAIKVIVIGLDGLEPKIGTVVAGKALPNMAELCAAGGYTRVDDRRAQTPVAWSTFARAIPGATASTILCTVIQRPTSRPCL